MRLITLLPIFISAAVPVASYTVTGWSNKDCTGDKLDTVSESSGGSTCRPAKDIECFKFENADGFRMAWYTHDNCQTDDDAPSNGHSLLQGHITKEQLVQNRHTLETQKEGLQSWKIAPKK